MPDRRDRGGNSDSLIPEDKRAWALEVWADRDEVARLPGVSWMLREAAKELGIPDEYVDVLLRS